MVELRQDRYFYESPVLEKFAHVCLGRFYTSESISAWYVRGDCHWGTLKVKRLGAVVHAHHCTLCWCDDTVSWLPETVRARRLAAIDHT